MTDLFNWAHNQPALPSDEQKAKFEAGLKEAAAERRVAIEAEKEAREGAWLAEVRAQKARFAGDAERYRRSLEDSLRNGWRPLENSRYVPTNDVQAWVDVQVKEYQRHLEDYQARVEALALRDGRSRHRRANALRGRESEALALFMARVNKNPSSGCWEWKGAPLAVRADGVVERDYGQFSYAGTQWSAHMAALYLLKKEVVPPTYTIDHVCRNRSCVNPDHLEVVTAIENIERAQLFYQVTHGTECSWGHPLTPGNVTYSGRISSERLQGSPERIAAIARGAGLTIEEITARLDRGPPSCKRCRAIEADKRADDPSIGIIKSPEFRAIKETLSQKWPHCFKGYRPLKIDIEVDVITSLPELNARLLCAVVYEHRHSIDYLLALVEGASRIDLDGKTCSRVSRRQAEAADRQRQQKLLALMRAKLTLRLYKKGTRWNCEIDPEAAAGGKRLFQGKTKNIALANARKASRGLSMHIDRIWKL